MSHHQILNMKAIGFYRHSRKNKKEKASGKSRELSTELKRKLSKEIKEEAGKCLNMENKYQT